MENKKKSAENAWEKGIVNEIYEEIEKKNREHKKRVDLINAILN